MKKYGFIHSINGGIDQADTYLNSIMSRFEWLARQSGLGRKRDEVAEGYFSYPTGEHVIFYMISDAIVDIIGVLHHSMDIISHLGYEENRP